MAAALPPIRSRSTEPKRASAPPWKGSDKTAVAAERRRAQSVAEGSSLSSSSASSPAARLSAKPDPLQWQRSMGVRRGAKEQLSERSQRKSMIDSSVGGRLQYQQPRRSKGKSRRKQLEPADPYESMEVALHRNKIVRKNEGRSPTIQYAQTPGSATAPTVPRTTAALSGVDDEALPELDASDQPGAQSWKLEKQSAYLATVRAVNQPEDDDDRRKKAALRIQRFFRKNSIASAVGRESGSLARPESRQEPLPSLDASSSIWDVVGEDSERDFQRSRPLHRLVHGEDSSRLRFYQLYSEHLDRMDEESHTELGLHRVQEDGWRREEIVSILHQLSHSISAQDVRERCADVGVVLTMSESENADEVRRILRDNLQQCKRRAEEKCASPRVIGEGKHKSMHVAAVDPDARARRLELMSKQGSAHHYFLEECLQRGVHPLPIMLKERNTHDDKVLDLAHYRMGDQIAAALAAGLNKRAENIQIETLILTDNNISGPQDQLRGSRRLQQQSSKGASLLSSGAEALASIIKQNADTITHLDLSENPLGPSGCQVLANAFANSSQALAVQTLRLNNCKLGDKGTRALLGLLSEWCPYLNSLDIGRNNLGQGGSAALAIEEILVNETVPIATLSLNYNNFGEKHMRMFALAIPENTFLTHLDLSWNSVGCEGAMILAQSLRTNETLKILDVTHDKIKEKGSFVLADMLKENKGLQHLILSDNPIGQRGGRAILRAIDRMVELGTAATRQVTLSKCNYNYSSADEIFDPANPGGTYECDLTDPYDRAVAWELVELAWKEEGENWENETIDNQPYDLPEPEEGEVWGRDPSFGAGCWYQLPAEGVLRVTYIQTPKVPRFSDCIDAEMVEKLIELMSDRLINDHGTRLVTLASFDFYFTAEIACTLTILTRDTLNKVTCMSALIPRIIDPINMSSDCYDWMTVSELAALEGRAPDLFNFIPTNPTDHYKLELGRTDHRRMLTRLVCICAEDKAFREKYNMYDTSQKGDGEGWRNETMTTSEALMGPPVVNGSVDWNAPSKQYQPFQPVPWDIEEEDCTGGRLKYGTLEFDFVSTNVSQRVVGQAPMEAPVFRLFLKELQTFEDMVTVMESGKAKGSRKKRNRGRNKTATKDQDVSTKTSSRQAKPMRLVRYSSAVAVVTHTHPSGESVNLTVEDVHRIAKVQSVIRGRIHRNSAKGIHVTPHRMLKKGAMNLIHAERLRFQRLSKSRTNEVQATKQQQKQMARARTGKGSNSPKAIGARTTGAKGLVTVSQAATRLGKSHQGQGGLNRTLTTTPVNALERVKTFRDKIEPQHRPCWWTPSQEKRVSASSVEAAKSMVREKQLQMLRRSTMQYFFNARQVTAILSVIDAGPNMRAHVEALVILFAVITDLERVNFPQLLGHSTYDKDGNHFIDWDELRALREDRNPWVVLESRLGAANLFNPIRPEREYALDLRQSDCRVVAQCLVVLSAEKGENLLYTSYNGLPFDVGAKWIEAVPDLGMFCGEFVTPAGCALMALRLAMARRLLMPGYGRWRAVPFALRCPDEDWRAQDASIGLDKCTIDADGSLVERVDEDYTDKTLSLNGLLGALRFKRKLKTAAFGRLANLKVRTVDTKAAAPLSVIVKMSLAAQRAQLNASASKKNAGSLNGGDETLSSLQKLIEGDTVESTSRPTSSNHLKAAGSPTNPVDKITDAFAAQLIHRPGGLKRQENEAQVRESLGLAAIDH